jgi:SAM-dependent methyltransferase
VSSFEIKSDDKIIDLGCGTGLLTLALARFSSNVEGIDKSKRMLRIARSRDANNRVCWINKAVQNFDFGLERYKLIISFEALHEFLTRKLIKKLENAIVHREYLAFGWFTLHWEEILKEVIVNTFASRSFLWGDWDYYLCPDFPGLIDKDRFPHQGKESIQVTTTTDVCRIADYLTSIDKTAYLPAKTRQEIRDELVTRFRFFLKDDRISGITTYSVYYYKKS